MTSLEFTTYWKNNFADCPPINYLLKEKFTDKWLRIHSLPESKRYPENNTDWDILLARQHKIFEDAFYKNDDIIVIANMYQIDDSDDFEFIYKQQCLENFNWKNLPAINIFNISKQQIDKEVFIIPHLSNFKFDAKIIEPILVAIAKDELRLFFINPKTNTVIAPYDGGADLIYADTKTRDLYKEWYKEWEQQDSF
jgi:hypothetical protein